MNRTINIDFYTLNTGNPKLLSIFDNSDWEHAEPLPSYLSIILPGSTREITYTFSKNKINTLNSNNLGLTCKDDRPKRYSDLPDGIYTIKLISGFEGIEETKYYLKNDIFDLEYAKVMAMYGTNIFDELFLNYMLTVKGLLEVAKAHTKLGDFVKASRFFEEAKKHLNNYTNTTR